MFQHTVHFWLKPELGEDERAEFLAACKALGESPNVARCRVGVPAGTPREVVDNTYDVQLTCHFAGQAEHDAYQSPDDQAHTEFIDQYKGHWARVLIYDSLEA